MSTLHPFRALRPTPNRASGVAAVPYDVVNRDEAKDLAKGNDLSFLHVSRAEIDLPENVDPYSNQVYLTAEENFKKLISGGKLVTENEASLYVYELKSGTHVQTGIAGCFSVDEYDENIIKKHERTRKDKEDDRTRHVITLKAQTGPVFLAYREKNEVSNVVEQTQKEKPLYDFQAQDGVRHTVWKIGNPETLVNFFKSVDVLYIADGHHRAASASRARAQLREKNPNHTGSEEYNFFLAVAFPANQLKILPYNRLLKDLDGKSVKELLHILGRTFEVTEKSLGAFDFPERANFAMYLSGKWWQLKPKFKIPHDPIGSLDVSILQNAILDPVFGIKDPRTDKRIEFVGGIRGNAELESQVDSGNAGIAFSLHPTTMNQLMAISDAGEIMPPKSTWFEPKLRDGLLSHLI